MIFKNAQHRIDEAIEKGGTQNISFIYNELLTHDTITSVFDYIFRKGLDFSTSHEEYRFIVTIKGK